jgi:tetratricopeptide (TPR) repeat protein
MRRFFVSLVLLTSITHLAFAQECDKAKLRAAMAFPQVSIPFQTDFDTATHDNLGNPIDLVEEIARETKRLSGGFDDAEIYYNLADMHESLKDEKRRDDACQKVLDILKPHLDTTEKKQVRSLILCCRALRLCNSPSVREWEVYAQRAVRLAPEDFNAWLELGFLNIRKGCRAILGDTGLVRDKWFETACERASANLVPLRTLVEAQKCVEDARRCCDRAKELAPNVPKCREMRLNLLTGERLFRLALGEASGKKINGETIVATLADLRAESRIVAELHSDNINWQVGPMFIEAGVALGQAAIDSGLDPKNPANIGSWSNPKLKETLAVYLMRIEHLIETAVPVDRALRGLKVMMMVSALMEDPQKEEHYARRVLQINPKEPEALYGLVLALVDAKRDKDADQAAFDYWQKVPTAHSAYTFARRLDRTAKYAESEKILRLGLQKEPGDYGCAIALAALLMKTRQAAEEGMDEPRQWLEKAEKSKGPDTDGQRGVGCDYYRAIHLALSGDTVIAHLKLLRLQGEHPTDGRFPKALSAFKR